MLLIGDNQQLQQIELLWCRTDILHWFDNWVWTYDPKIIEVDPTISAYLPFDLFSKQRELIQWIQQRIANREDGLCEKSRDMGATWCFVAFAWWAWRFRPGFKTTFGSRLKELVDKLGSPDSIFEKIRQLQRRIPPWMVPKGFDERMHDKACLLINPENGNTIVGEGGDEMGRAGRSTCYVIDEAAHIEHAERLDAATSGNTDTRFWVSSVMGTTNLFARKRFGGGLNSEQIFRLHYLDDPRKTPEWVVNKKRQVEPHAWASDFEIDYQASVEGVLIPAAWVESAKRVATLIDIEPAVEGIGGGDIGAGKAKSVFVARFGPVVTVPVSWGDPDTIDTAYKMLDCAKAVKLTRKDGHECFVRSLRFDSIGVGAGVGAALKRSPHPSITVSGVNVGNPPTDMRWPDGETSQEKFTNLKAEASWRIRERFKRTHETVLALEGKEGGRQHLPSDLISLPLDSAGPTAIQMNAEISLVRWNRTETGKIQIETKKSLSARGVASPDYWDALVLTDTGPSMLEIWAAFGQANI